MDPNYIIIRCQTTDKFFVMDLLCDANEYKLIRDHVDAVYYNGDDDLEKEYTRQMVKSDLELLYQNGIRADSKPEYIDDWYFVPLPIKQQRL